MALLNASLNIENVKMGKEMDEFRNFSLALDPSTRGDAVGNSDKIREGQSGISVTRSS